MSRNALPENFHRSRRRRPASPRTIAAGISSPAADRSNRMTSWAIALLSLVLALAAPAHAAEWQPADGYTQTPLWPGKAPGELPLPGPETVTVDKNELIGGKTVVSVTNIARPTVT